MRKFVASAQLLNMDWPNEAIDNIDITCGYRGTLMSQECSIDTVRLLSASTSNTLVGLCVRKSDFYLPSDPIKEFLHGDKYSHIQSILKLFYGQQQISVSKCATAVKEILYMGENFQTEPFLSDNNIIIACWLSDKDKIDTNYKGCRCGKIQSIVVLDVKTAQTTETQIILHMKWYKCHPEPYKYGMHTQLYFNSFLPSNDTSYLPIQRIISKCVIYPTVYNYVKCLVVVPVAGKWVIL